MRTRKKYRITPQCGRLLCLLREHPGLSATQFAVVAWPQMKRGVDGKNPVLLAALLMRRYQRKGLVRIKYSGDPFKERAWCLYYLTDYGYEISEYLRNSNP